MKMILLFALTTTT